MHSSEAKRKTKNESYYTLNMRIKGILGEIIDLAYESEPNMLPKYKAFKFYVINKELSSAGGYYYPKEQKIELFNTSQGPKFLAKAALHELAHHIDFIKHKTTGHQKPFYEEYARLIYASMDLGILTREDFDDNWARDKNKVKRIVEKYIPHPKKRNTQNKSLIKVYKAYSIKDLLKANHYGWNGLEQVWEKEPDNMEEELNFLAINDVSAGENPNGGAYYICADVGMKVNAMVMILASGKTYENRDILKENGFRYDKEKKQWLMKISAEKWKETQDKLKNIQKTKDLQFLVNKSKS